MAGTVGFIARRQARTRWRALVALTVFVGLIGGLSLSLIAGARRSASVVDRYLAATPRYDFGVYLEKSHDQSLPTLTQADVQAIPGVVRAVPSTYVALTGVDGNGRETGGINGVTVDWKHADPTVRIVDGDVPDGADERDVAVNQDFVKQFGLSTGDTVTARMFGPGQFDAVQSGVYEPNGPEFRFRIRGVFRSPESISSDEVHKVTGSGYGDTNAMVVSQAFFERHRDEFLDFGANFGIVLRDGAAGRHEFTKRVRALLPPGAVVRLGPAGSGLHRSSFSTPVGLETSVLLALGISLAAIGAISAALVLRAEQRIHEEDVPTLRGLGCTAPQLALASAFRALPVAVGGAALAVVVAYALSGRYPVGIGREIELHPGFDANVAVFGVGALAIVTLLVGLSFLLGRPRRVTDRLPSRRRTLARWLGRAGAPLDLTLGSQLAFERGRGVRSVPSRAAIVGGAAAFAIVTAVAIYTSGVDRLYTEPVARGWPWDAVVGNTNFELSRSTVRHAARDEQIHSVTGSRTGRVRLNGKNSDLLAFDARGDAPPEVVAGRLPETAGEIALGPGTMADLGVEIGSTITMAIDNGEFQRDGKEPVPVKLRVVGTSLAPSMGGDADFGYVSLVTLDAIAAAGGKATPQILLVDLRGGRAPASYAALDRSYQEEIATDSVPARVGNLHRIRRLPLVGLLLAGLLGTLLLLYTLAVSARARAHELAVMRALGLTSRRVRRVLAWEGGVLGAAIVLLGIPVGLVLGIAVWNAVASDLGVAHDATVTPWISALAVLAPLVAVGASLLPARRAGRERVATLLRVE